MGDKSVLKFFCVLHILGQTESTQYLQQFLLSNLYSTSQAPPAKNMCTAACYSLLLPKLCQGVGSGLMNHSFIPVSCKRGVLLQEYPKGILLGLSTLPHQCKSTLVKVIIRPRANNGQQERKKEKHTAVCSNLIRSGFVRVHEGQKAGFSWEE